MRYGRQVDRLTDRQITNEAAPEFGQLSLRTIRRRQMMIVSFGTGKVTETVNFDTLWCHILTVKRHGSS